MFTDLENKVVVITGGLGFLGKQFVNAFVESKSKVVILDIIPKSKYKNISNKYITYFKCDLSKEKQVRSVSKKIVKKFNKINVLINCVAKDYIPKKNKKRFFSLESLPLNIWNRDIEVGLSSLFIATKIIGSLIKKNKEGGSIINLSSDLGIISPDQRIYKKLNFVKPITYSAIKHGVIGITKYTATYWAKYNIRCNSVAPGGMYNNQNKNFLKEIKKLIPLNRLGRINEYNKLILFLASDSSSYITGSTIVIDGGRTSW